MRLVSQNGNVDISYEQAHILCNMECVMARVGNYEYTLGKYSDKSKALKVMEMLRNAYVGLPILFQNVDMDENVVDKLKEWKRDGIVLLHDNAKTKIEQVNNAIFQFPADSEVEV